MSDVIKSPSTGVNNQAPTVKDAASKWRVLLAVFALVSLACLAWLVRSLASVSESVNDFNQLIFLPAIIFLVGLVGIAYASSSSTRLAQYEDSVGCVAHWAGRGWTALNGVFRRRSWGELCSRAVKTVRSQDYEND